MDRPARVERSIERRPEPSLIFLRREDATSIPELVIVEKNTEFYYPISLKRLLRLVADGAQMLSTTRET